MNFEDIILEEEQRELFLQIAEIIKSIPRENRSPMIEANSKDGTCLIMPKNNKKSNIKGFASGDLEILADAGLLRVGFGSKGSKTFTITPTGFKYYEWLLEKQEKLLKRDEIKPSNLPDLNKFPSSLREVLIRVDSLKKDIDALLPVKDKYIEKFESKVRLEWNYHSNKLEGNELNYGETRELLYHDKTSGKALKDHREIIGHDEAITYVEDRVENGEIITEKFIRELNKKILNEPYEKEAITENGEQTTKTIHPGRYKSTPNHVKTKTGDVFKFAEPHEVPHKMNKLIEWYREIELYPLIKASQLHYRFVNIHPFDDGNGRVARLLMNYCLMEFGFPPIVIKTEQKDEYYSCLRKADAGDLNPLFTFLGGCLIDSFEMYISAAKGEDINEYADLNKRLKVFDKTLSQDEQEEIRYKKSDEFLEKRFNDSIWPLFEKFSLMLEDFYRYFTERELKYVINQTTYSKNLELDGVKSKFEKAINNDENLRNIGLEIRLNGFKKGGLRPLNTSRKVQIEFQDYLYVVNPKQRGNEKIPTIKKLYHQTLEDDIEWFVYQIGSNLLDQLEQHYEQIKNGNN